MIVKLHKKDEKTIVAICDEALLGKTFEEGDLILDLSSPFYQGDKLGEVEAGDLLRNADIVNLVGEHSVKLGIAEGVVDENHVQKINSIPYAQAVVEHE